jgi:hemerythrin
MAFVWDASLATGVDEVDREHRELFRQIAGLDQAMRSGKGRNEIEQIVRFIGNYTANHFAHEESWMEKCGCPAAQANKLAHAQLIAKYKGYEKRLEAEGATSALALEIYNTLSSWLAEHIRKIDTQLMPAPVH